MKERKEERKKEGDWEGERKKDGGGHKRQRVSS